MFRCTASPPEASFPPTLAGLNMVLSPAGTPVDATTSAPFAFFHTDDDRVNSIRKEAFHAAIRAEMRSKLDQSPHHVREYYITNGDKLRPSKPQEKHIPLLMSQVSTLRTARDIIIVVGESGQDCGVFAWRLVRESMKRGTCLGFMEGVKEEFEGKENETPGVVFLNPGQLYYSYRDNVAKTLVSWNDGPRASSEQEYADAIDEENLMEGHRTAGEHVNTFVEKILPGLINKNTRLYVVAIGDGAEHVLHALNNRIIDKTVPPCISSQFEAVALICPEITTPKDQFCEKLIWQIAMAGKAWVPSTEHLGQLLATPIIYADKLFGTHRPIEHPTLDNLRISAGDGLNSDSTSGTEAAETSLEKMEIKDQDGENESPEAVKARLEAEAPLAMTFSAGKEDDAISETTLDACMSKVMEFLWMKRDEKREQEATRRRFEEMRFRKENDAKLAAASEEDPFVD